MTDAPTPSEDKAARTSLGELLAEVTRDLSTLMRQEIALARAELTESAKRAGKGAGLLGGAGYAGFMAVLFLSIALWWGLGHLIDNGWSAVVVAAIWGLIALVLYLRGKKEMKTVQGAPQTVDSLKKIPETLKKNEENR
ncbi:putative superfamily III holin-X [Glaciihabitans tibetensis]|uniref:Putative superfamily III holin-X n=1 Tax=Glaciihabitans tibetensis TaxID=1266600 RepID=A0A2T0VD06_9MICO|nr:phage holin family protein [Glaciihabitans tibetensis]PRY68062.1 putative superfamily III holin-X [Glaciihabitans tibetensis]